MAGDSPSASSGALRERISRADLERITATALEDRVVGCAIAVVDGDRVEHLGHGRRSRDDSDQPDEHTVFEIGSATKVFTALLLAEMVERGEVGLDDPLSDHLPDGVASPRRDEREPTLGQLADHTSGLPRLPPNLDGPDLRDPYAGYGEAELFEGVGRAELRTVPGERYAYSNFAVGLLGTLLSRAAQQPYPALVQARLLEPLGLRHTGFETEGSAVVPGHDATGNAVPSWTFQAIAPAGALLSTTVDLSTFLRANLAPEGPLGTAIRRTHEPRAEIPGGRIGLGWHVDGDGVRWHNGQTAGHHAYLGFDPAHDAGVAVLCNTANGLPDALGDAVLDHIAGRPNAIVQRALGE